MTKKEQIEKAVDRLKKAFIESDMLDKKIEILRIKQIKAHKELSLAREDIRSLRID